jgi:hypothetical protein
LSKRKILKIFLVNASVILINSYFLKVKNKASIDGIFGLRHKSKKGQNMRVRPVEA